MGTNWLDDYLRNWPKTNCAECGETCIACEDAIKLGEKGDDIDTREVMHRDCFKKRMPTLDEFRQRNSMICLVCRQSCDGGDDVVVLALGHAMHGACYEKWLHRQDSDSFVRRMPRATDLPRVVLSGEEGLSRKEIARRRNGLLFGRRPQLSAPAVPESTVTPSAGSCNEGASVDAEGEDNRSLPTETEPNRSDFNP